MNSSQVVKDYGLSKFVYPDVASPRNQKIVTKTIKFKKLKINIKTAFGTTAWNEITDYECMKSARTAGARYSARIISARLHENNSIFRCKIKFKVEQRHWISLVDDFMEDLAGYISDVRY